MKDLKIRPKNYGILSGTVYQSIKTQLADIKEIAVSDSTKASTSIIKIDLTSLLHDAVMHHLAQNGVHKANSIEDPNYSNGINIDLEMVELTIDKGRLTVHAQRDHERTDKFIESVRESLKSGGE